MILRTEFLRHYIRAGLRQPLDNFWATCRSAEHGISTHKIQHWVNELNAIGFKWRQYESTSKWDTANRERNRIAYLRELSNVGIETTTCTTKPYSDILMKIRKRASMSCDPLKASSTVLHRHHRNMLVIATIRFLGLEWPECKFSRVDVDNVPTVIFREAYKRYMRGKGDGFRQCNCWTAVGYRNIAKHEHMRSRRKKQSGKVMLPIFTIRHVPTDRTWLFCDGYVTRCTIKKEGECDKQAWARIVYSVRKQEIRLGGHIQRRQGVRPLQTKESLRWAEASGPADPSRVGEDSVSPHIRSGAVRVHGGCDPQPQVGGDARATAPDGRGPVLALLLQP